MISPDIFIDFAGNINFRQKNLNCQGTSGVFTSLVVREGGWVLGRSVFMSVDRLVSIFYSFLFDSCTVLILFRYRIRCTISTALG